MICKAQVQPKVVQIRIFTLTHFSSQTPISPQSQLLTDMLLKVLVVRDTSTMHHCNNRVPPTRVPDQLTSLEQAEMVSGLGNYSLAMWIGMAEDLALPVGARAAGTPINTVLQFANAVHWTSQDLRRWFACMCCKSINYTIQNQLESRSLRRPRPRWLHPSPRAGWAFMHPSIAIPWL